MDSLAPIMAPIAPSTKLYDSLPSFLIEWVQVFWLYLKLNFAGVKKETLDFLKSGEYDKVFSTAKYVETVTTEKSGTFCDYINFYLTYYPAFISQLAKVTVMPTFIHTYSNPLVSLNVINQEQLKRSTRWPLAKPRYC